MFELIQSELRTEWPESMKNKFRTSFRARICYTRSYNHVVRLPLFRKQQLIVHEDHALRARYFAKSRVRSELGFGLN